MIRRTTKRLVRRLQRWVGYDHDRFLRHARGVIHVGANAGQERDKYAKRDLDVLWIEPIPHVFEELERNVRHYPRQRALQALVAGEDGKEYPFHIANNNGASSSIFELDEHRRMYPNIVTNETIVVQSVTLPTLIETHDVPLSRYDTLILDTQGSELLVLEGSEPILRHFEFIKTEAPNFSAYKGCPLLAEIERFLDEHGFAELSRHEFSEKPGVGSYFDVVYRRVD